MTEEHNHPVPCLACTAELEMRIKNEESGKLLDKCPSCGDGRAPGEVRMLEKLRTKLDSKHKLQALITEGLKDEKLKYWYGEISEKKKFEPWQLECTCEHFGDDHDGLGPCDNCQCQKFREKSKC